MDSRPLRLGLAPCLLVGLIACGERAPGPQTHDGPRLNVQVGALTLDGVTDVAYRLAVKTPTNTVWERTVRSTDYGDGAGSLSTSAPATPRPPTPSTSRSSRSAALPMHC